jgi:hypothetical protein
MIELWSTRQPKTTRTAASQRGCVPNCGSEGSGGNLSQQLPAAVTECKPLRASLGAAVLLPRTFPQRAGQPAVAHRRFDGLTQ